VTLKDITQRVQRLERLSHAFGKELLAWKDGNIPVLHRERVEYREAIHRALSGIETARTVLVKARQRLEAET
jgi:hypothetical protein